MIHFSHNLQSKKQIDLKRKHTHYYISGIIASCFISLQAWALPPGYDEEKEQSIPAQSANIKAQLFESLNQSSNLSQSTHNSSTTHHSLEIDHDPNNNNSTQTFTKKSEPKEGILRRKKSVRFNFNLNRVSSISGRTMSEEQWRKEKKESDIENPNDNSPSLSISEPLPSKEDLDKNKPNLRSWFNKWTETKNSFFTDNQPKKFMEKEKQFDIQMKKAISLKNKRLNDKPLQKHIVDFHMLCKMTENPNSLFQALKNVK